MSLKMEAREAIASYYLDFFNNYLTLEKFAEHNGLYKEEAKSFIKLARKVANRPHPDE